MSDTKFIDLIKSKYGDLVLDSHNFRGDQTVTVRKDCGNDFFKFQVPGEHIDTKFSMMTPLHLSKKNIYFWIWW